ncbi:hypothetical protein FA13DRAFT_1735346 [Coprinellus micaceus]|uniref:Uncharacterized protein n=1 Tax=Coprinellus micaceus TaxID=71717 RepID=A0A4Y7T3T5_COPMI|nr:hypothetical protein FA13DRAFT_1735346 [Coprinellus micaceus]
MPFSERLKRLARSLRLSSQRIEPKVPVLSGWNGLPDDVIILLLTEYLGVTNPSAHSLSITCRAYASLSRTCLLYMVCIPGDATYDPETQTSSGSSLERLRYDLRSNPRLCERIGTLRNLPSLTGLGRSLVGILTRYHFPSLHTFELPLLKLDENWSSLALPLRDAILGFIQRHNGTLRELSMTTQYPLALVRLCSPGLTRLEYRFEEPGFSRDFRWDSLTVDNFGKKSKLGVEVHSSKRDELSIMDSGWGRYPEIADQLQRGSRRGSTESPPPILLNRLKRLTSGSHIPPLLVLNHCAHTLKYLGVYSTAQPSLDLPALHSLEHLTLSIDHWRGTDSGTLPWISNTIAYFFDPTEARAPFLKTLKVVVRTLGRTAEESIWEMEQGWMSHGTHSAANSGSRAPAWSLKDFSVVVCLHDRTKYYAHPKQVGPPGGLEETLLAQGLKTRLVAGLSRFDPNVIVGVELVRDRFSRWLRYPSIQWAPLHY